MRATLTGLHAELGGGAAPDVRALTRDLLEGEVEAPTADVRWLISQDVDPDEFYAKEIAPCAENSPVSTGSFHFAGSEPCSLVS